MTLKVFGGFGWYSNLTSRYFCFSATPVGTVKTYGSLVQLIARDPKLAFAAVIVGRRFGLILYISAICLLALQCLLLLKGVAYRPLWIAQPGGATVIAVAGLLAACFIAYITGKRVGSPISSFNAARLSCDRIVSSHGYWFDNRHDPDHYKDDHNFLLGALRDYERLLNALDEAPESEFSRYNTMVVHYQRALLLATLARYDDALAALSNARQLKESLSGSTMWDPNEEPEFESRICSWKGNSCWLAGIESGHARSFYSRGRSARSLETAQVSRKPTRASRRFRNEHITGKSIMRILRLIRAPSKSGGNTVPASAVPAARRLLCGPRHCCQKRAARAFRHRKPRMPGIHSIRQNHPSPHCYRTRMARKVQYMPEAPRP